MKYSKITVYILVQTIYQKLISDQAKGTKTSVYYRKETVNEFSLYLVKHSTGDPQYKLQICPKYVKVLIIKGNYGHGRVTFPENQ